MLQFLDSFLFRDQLYKIFRLRCVKLRDVILWVILVEQCYIIIYTIIHHYIAVRKWLYLVYTGYTQKNCAVSKVNRKFPTFRGHNVHRQQRQLSKFLMRYQQFASHAYCGAAGPVSKIASQQEKAFCLLSPLHKHSVSTNCRWHLVMLFLHGASFLNRARNSRCTVITDLDTSKRGTQKAFSCCDAILETGPTAPQ